MTIDQKINFIGILDKTIKHLESNKEDYIWTEVHQCNCGFLIQTALDMKPDKIESLVTESDEQGGSDFTSGPWANMWQKSRVCQKTGLPISEIFKGMEDLGLTNKDMANLERLSDPKILRVMGVRPDKLYNEDPDNVIAYMTTWKGILEKEVVCPLEK